MLEPKIPNPLDLAISLLKGAHSNTNLPFLLELAAEKDKCFNKKKDLRWRDWNEAVVAFADGFRWLYCDSAVAIFVDDCVIACGRRCCCCRETAVVLMCARWLTDSLAFVDSFDSLRLWGDVVRKCGWDWMRRVHIFSHTYLTMSAFMLEPSIKSLTATILTSFIIWNILLLHL